MTLVRITPTLLWVAGILWPVVCVGVVAARFATRRALKASIGWDDWLTLPALVLVLGMAATIMAGTARHALGYPTPQRPSPDQLSPEELQAWKSYWSIVILQTAAITLIKLSCLFFYRRIFYKSTHRLVRIMIDSLRVLIAAWGIGLVFSWTFGCKTHWDYLWDATSSQTCGANHVTLNLALSFSDMIMDVIVFILPIPLILRISMSTASKLALMGIFALGTAAIAASIVRVVIICLEVNLQFAMNADQNLISTAGIYVLYIEACFALCAISLPILAGASMVPAVRHTIDRLNHYASHLLSSIELSSGNRSTNITKNDDATPSNQGSEQQLAFSDTNTDNPTNGSVRAQEISDMP